MPTVSWYIRNRQPSLIAMRRRTSAPHSCGVMAMALFPFELSVDAGHLHDADRRRQRFDVRMRALDLAHDVGTAHHLAERCVAGTRRAAGVEETVVTDAQKELRRAGVRIGRARHRNRTVGIVQPGLA